MSDAGSRHGLALRLIHWTTVGLVAAQFALAALNALLYEPRPRLAEALVQTHLSLGALTFAVTLARLWVRLTPGMARAPAVPAPWKYLIPGTHLILYGCLLLLPVAGYGRLAALGFEMTILGMIRLPALGFDPTLANRLADLHGLLATVLAAAVVLHVAGAVLHRRVFGEPVLHRMALSIGRRGEA